MKKDTEQKMKLKKLTMELNEIDSFDYHQIPKHIWFKHDQRPIE